MAVCIPTHLRIYSILIPLFHHTHFSIWVFRYVAVNLQLLWLLLASLEPDTFEFQICISTYTSERFFEHVSLLITLDVADYIRSLIPQSEICGLGNKPQLTVNSVNPFQFLWDLTKNRTRQHRIPNLSLTTELPILQRHSLNPFHRWFQICISTVNSVNTSQFLWDLTKNQTRHVRPLIKWMLRIIFGHWYHNLKYAITLLILKSPKSGKCSR